MDKYVGWIQGAVEVAEKLEFKSPMELRKLQRKLKEAQEVHDDLLLQYGINSNRKNIGVRMPPPDGQPSSPLFTASKPFDEELEEVPSYLKAKKKYAKELKMSQPFVRICRTFKGSINQSNNHMFMYYCSFLICSRSCTEKHFEVFFSIEGGFETFGY